jgi:EpsI family protein
MINRNYFSIAVLLIITGFISWKFYFFDYQQAYTYNIYTFPKVINQWKSQELDFDKTDRALLGSNSILSRRYDSPEGKHIYLYMVYSEYNPKAIIPPEISYTDIDLSIIDKGKKSIRIDQLSFDLKVNWLISDSNKNQQLVYYWYKVGDLYTSSYWKQQLLLAYNNIVGKKAGSALIRISTDIVDGKEQKAVVLADKFSNLIMAELSQHLP